MREGRVWLFLSLIFVAGLLFRVLFINNFPVGFTADEASFGYDAYSLLQTGKDQWGNQFPLVFTSFGDYKAPLLGYAMVPFVAAFDLTKMAVRLPGALFGTAAIVVTFLLAHEIAALLEWQGRQKQWFSIIAALLLAFSPWHIMLSRGAFEANVTTFFLPLGVYFFLVGLRKPQSLVWASLAFGANLFTYHAAKLVTVLLVGVLVCLFYRKLRSVKFVYVGLAILVFSLFFFATAYTFTQGAGNRAKDVSLLKTSLQYAAVDRLNANMFGMPPLLAYVLHNKYVFMLRWFGANYMQYFSPQFLFSQGPAETTYGMLPGRGVLYWTELPLLLGFIVALFRYVKNSAVKLLVAWLLLGPIPAALTIGPGYAGNRAAIMMPAIQLVLAIGAIVGLQFIRQFLGIKYLRLAIVGWTVFGLVLIGAFIDDYFFLAKSKMAPGMLYGDLEVAELFANRPGDFQVIMNKRLTEPHIFFAFAQKMNPLVYQQQTKEWNLKQKHLTWVDEQAEYRVGNALFKDVIWPVDERTKPTYVVGKPEMFPFDVKPTETIRYPDGKVALYIVELPQNRF